MAKIRIDLNCLLVLGTHGILLRGTWLDALANPSGYWLWKGNCVCILKIK